MTVAYHLDPGLLPDLSRAACRDADPELFFTDDRTRQAKSVCAGCPDAGPCLAYALRTGSAGVWGGTDGAERALLGRRPDLGVLPVPARSRVGAARSRVGEAHRIATPQAPLTGAATPAPSRDGKHDPTPPPRPRTSSRTRRKSSKETVMDTLLTVDQAARALGTSPRFIRRIIAERRIAYVKVGKHVRITAADLSGFVDAGRQEPARL